MHSTRTHAILCGATIFLSSFLLFSIQPILAKLILPWFGGSAAVWTTCLVFFQTALLAGYSYSWLGSRIRSKNYQTAIHIALLGAAILLLPVVPGADWRPAADAGTPALRILAMLTVVLGLPYFLLSATAPLLQSWLARAGFDSSRTYRLFALSNAGALLALISYPVFIEARWPTHTQAQMWSIGFAIFAGLCAVTALILGRASAPSPATPATGSPSLTQRLEWIGLAAAGSMMLLATTNQLTENVAPVPLLWIVPLAIYLITFILAFENPRWYRRNLMLRLLAIALISIAYLISDINLSDAILVSLPIFCAGLFIACMFCHGELNGLKPPADQLTSFYLSIALGGALGAIFVGLIAPVVFAGVYELPVAMLAVAALAVWLMWPYGWSQRLLWSAVAITMIVVAGAQVRAYHRNAVELVRGFYGSLRVVLLDDARVLYHGTVEHGAQFTDERRRKSPTTYYGYSSGAGLALESLKSPKRVGVIGLGAGTLAAYSQAGDDVHFYEINPQMVDIANRQFLFLRDSGARIEITLGDARLSLESEPPQNFDALLVDAFSGDAIPVHLLTKEAFAVYLRHLKSDGILAIHVSNQFLDLAPIVAQLAALNHLPAREFISGKDESRRLLAATWIVMTRNPGFWSRPEIARTSRPISVRPDLRPWTDDYNNLLQVMQWIPVQ